MNNYETIIGIEVHTQLNTKHKIFSPSINDKYAEPNTNIHPIDLALPGTLPRFNEEVLQKALIVCHGLKMDITKEMSWDRKNYFYHDNPKGYQITQFSTPIGRNGEIKLDNGKVIRIDFMHMEEDTAKSLHSIDGTLLDFNRCGTPLLEIVTKPDIRSAQEAKEYLEKLRQVLLYLDVSDGKLEDGSFRVDVNISIRPFGQKEYNPKVEIKNLNSFFNVGVSIEKEITKQKHDLNKGIKTLQATKRFNETKKTLDTMRVKEGSIDYRYMPEPDLPKIILTDDYIKKSTRNIPLLPSEIAEKFESYHKLEKKEIKQLLSNKEMSLFVIECLNVNLSIKNVTNYLLSNVISVMNKDNLIFEELYLTTQKLIEIESFLESGKISSNHVKQILPLIITKDQSVETVVKALGIEQITDEKVIEQIINEVLDDNEQSIIDYNSGKDRAFGYLIGQIMKKSKGQANPKIVNEILVSKLKNYE